MSVTKKYRVTVEYNEIDHPNLAKKLSQCGRGKNRKKGPRGAELGDIGSIYEELHKKLVFLMETQCYCNTLAQKLAQIPREHLSYKIMELLIYGNLVDDGKLSAQGGKPETAEGTKGKEQKTTPAKIDSRRDIAIFSTSRCSEFDL